MSFVVDTESLRTHGRAVAESAARAAADLDGLPAAGGGWGASEAAVVYQELVALTGEALGLVVGGLAKSGTGTQRMAEVYADTEHVVAGRFA